MEPREFLAAVREAVVDPKNKDGIYVVYDDGEPFMHAKQILELEEQLGRESFVFCCDVINTQDSVFNLYFRKEESTYAVEVFVFPEEQDIRVYPMKKTVIDTWGEIETTCLQREIKLVMDYIFERPRFRLHFLMGSVKINA